MATPGNGVGIIIIIIVVVFITITTVWMDPPPHHHNCHHHNLKMVCGTSEKRRQYRRQTLIRRGKSNFCGEWIDTVTMGKHYLVAIVSHQTDLLIVLEGQSCTELKKCLGNISLDLILIYVLSRCGSLANYNERGDTFSPDFISVEGRTLPFRTRSPF